MRVSGSFIFALVMAIAGTASAATINVGFSPVVRATTVGNSVSVALFVSGLDPEVSVGSFDIFVEYDSNIIRASDVSFGPFLGNPNLGTALAGFDITSIPDQAEIFEVSLLSETELTALQDPVRNSGFSLASIIFLAETPGTSPLNLAEALAADASGTALAIAAGNGAITVVPVLMPEPGTLSLTLLALLAIIALSRRLSRDGSLGCCRASNISARQRP